MRLAEMLSYADIGQLHQLADTYECDCNVNSKNELIQSLLSSIKRDSTIQQQLSELSGEEFHFLLHIVFDARTTFTVEDLRAKAKFSYLQDLDRDTYRNLISIALKKGWIFRIPSRNAGASFALPVDMRRQWATAIFKKELYQQRILMNPIVYRQEGFALAQDVLIFLQYLRNHDVLSTAEGVIYKRNLMQILELLSIPEDPIEKGGWRFGYGRHFKEYPDRFSLIYDFCFYRGYLLEEPGMKIQVTQGAQEAEQLPAELLSIDIFKFWIRLYKRPVPGLAMFVRLLCHAAEKEWIAEKTLVSFMMKRLRPFYYDNEENIAYNRILKMLVHLGILRKGKMDDQEWAYQTTDWGKEMMDRVEEANMKTIQLDRKNVR
ncbi:MAG TPA: hypothetical protein VJ824_11735 [Bacillota bacterium]|nr:hypothetical protein [Bacillota bacterium]